MMIIIIIDNVHELNWGCGYTTRMYVYVYFPPLGLLVVLSNPKYLIHFAIFSVTSISGITSSRTTGDYNGQR